LIIDVTYQCNGSCNYCQWSEVRNQGNFQLKKRELFIPYETLDALGTERIVFSGGEPILSPYLFDLVSYYSKANLTHPLSNVVITNGLGLTRKKLVRLWNTGITGITFSLDSFDPQIAYQSRGSSVSDLHTIRKNFINACDFKQNHSLEIGINITLSHANLKESSLVSLFKFLQDYPIDWIKFQPLFDDGFVSQNSPELKLTTRDILVLKKCPEIIPQTIQYHSNNLTFWEDLEKILSGSQISGRFCGIDDRIAIALRGKLKFCYWCDDPIYGKTDEILTGSEIKARQMKFMEKKTQCKTGLYCFCLQTMKHKWYS
jgi:molybdenum cofactor biosynthesis enzyme MoaA